MFMIFLVDFYDISMRLLWDLNKISMIFLEDFLGNSMGFP